MSANGEGRKAAKSGKSKPVTKKHDQISGDAPERIMRALEPRILLDAAFVDTLDHAVTDAHDVMADAAEDAAQQDMQNAELLQAIAMAHPVDGTSSSPAEIAFVDAAVEDVDALVASFGPGIEVVMIEAGSDGVEQMAAALDGRTDIDAIHIISHGRSGTLDLGSTKLTEASMKGRHADEMAIIASAMSESGDILIYGCDFAANARGASAVEYLSEITGADVAASEDLTGAANLGGDWDLEVKTGAVDADTFDAFDWKHFLAGINDAPVLDISGTPDFGRTYAGIDLANHDGNTVADMLRSANLYSRDPITDADWDPDGIAVVGVNDTNGTWQYSTDGGTTWAAFGAVSQSNAVLLAADANVRFVANAGYADRNNTAASYSKTLISGIRSSEPSFSREESSLTADMTFSWHILDFGLSYVRAKQSADKALIAEESKRKIVNRIIEDVRTSYWRAISAERLLNGFRALESRVIKAQNDTRAIRKAGQTSPLAALTYERELVDIKKEIQRLDRELVTAKAQLAALINVKPGTDFALVVPKRNISDISINGIGDDMVLTALQNRPEVREILYKRRIAETEHDAAILELLPSPAVYAGINLDSNDFLYNTNWVSWGAKASWNAMRVFQYPARKGAIDAEGDLLKAQSDALAMAIATQVNIANARYRLLKKSAATAAEYYNIQRDILNQVKASVSAQAASEQTLIREEMNTLVAAVEFDVAYADLQNAFAAVYASVGIDPHGPDISTSMSVGELASALRSTWRSRGDQAG